MITYTGIFDLLKMIDACKSVAHLHLNKNNVDESEVPFCNEKGEVKHMQFLNAGGYWLYVGMRK